ncbi:Variant surface glycoprotein [Trypanosoma congolense IL3000]|uniref:Variant surface glycoprotein n=1 Tax=Trypanosoma congolense (strain IL3000) TaxID=1068625 RepID=F9WAC1_TRYCI|nr:Variant surface glycoprotein [Trypanosoma congolense IL3000]
MMGLRIWIFFLLVCGVFGEQKNDIARKTDHNLEEYNALCNLLKIAVHEWKELKSRGNEGPLKKALGRTIFGDDSGGDLEGVKSKAFPQVYNGLKESSLSRLLWCGGPYDEDSRKNWKHQPRWPGHSVPHDLVCLCTTGGHGWPFNNPAGDTVKNSLCGKPKEALEASENQGWGTGIQSHKGEKQIKATWSSITEDCLKDAGQEGNLKDALEKFIAKLNCTGASNHGKRCKLGEGDFVTYPCNGNEKVCVMYHNSTDTMEHKPWWVDLKNVLDTAEQQKKNEEEGRKQENEQKKQKAQNHEKSQPTQGPRTAVLTTAPQGSQEAEQDDTQNIPSPLATIEEESGTLITPTCTWFLGALFLI